MTISSMRAAKRSVPMINAGAVSLGLGNSVATSCVVCAAGWDGGAGGEYGGGASSDPAACPVSGTVSGSVLAVAAASGVFFGEGLAVRLSQIVICMTAETVRMNSTATTPSEVDERSPARQHSAVACESTSVLTSVIVVLFEKRHVSSATRGC